MLDGHEDWFDDGYCCRRPQKEKEQ